LEIEFAGTSSNPPIERRLIRLLRRLGYWTHPALIQRQGRGQGLHFAATLPMRAQPRRYQTDQQGLLFGTERIHIVDGASMSRLPAKNLTFTIMANALRIGRQLARDL
jgi:choline dehydrogenase-like flavoprotein